jgi:opacity protein-like surface antigen
MRHFIAALAASLLITASAQAAVPTATTGNANSITQTTAKLHGTVKPNKENSTWHFEFGTTTAYGTNTPEQGPITAGSGSTGVATDVGGLAPGTMYHYRLVATNASGSIPGRDRTFTTRSAVSLNASKQAANFNDNVTLSGQVFGTAVAGITVTLQENPYPFGGWSDVATTTTDASGNYQFIRQLKTHTGWRVVAQTKPAGSSVPAFVLQQDTVTLKANTTRPKRRHTVLFTGFALPARVGAPVYVQRLGKRGWRTVLTAKLAPTPVADTVSYAVRLRHVVSGVYRAFVPGGYDHLADASAAKRITLRR